MRKTCLIVDDEASVRLLITAVLRKDGFQVVEATNANEAMTFLKKGGEHYQAVITDVQMPGDMDGLDLAHFVRQSFPRTPVLIISGYTQDERQLEGLEFLRKPFTVSALLDRVHQLVSSD